VVNGVRQPFGCGKAKCSRECHDLHARKYRRIMLRGYADTGPPDVMWRFTVFGVLTEADYGEVISAVLTQVSTFGPWFRRIEWYARALRRGGVERRMLWLHVHGLSRSGGRLTSAALGEILRGAAAPYARDHYCKPIKSVVDATCYVNKTWAETPAGRQLELQPRESRLQAVRFGQGFLARPVAAIWKELQAEDRAPR
jgi:hypothetical protein